MADATYLQARQKYARPQAVLWSKNQGVLSDGLYLPYGSEIGALEGIEPDASLVDQFLILSDHNRSPIDIKPNRIDQRQRMINGTMRSYYTADKKTTTIQWQNLPSRSSDSRPDFNEFGVSTITTPFTVDGGAGGNEMLSWHEENKGPFWMFLAYDKFTDFGTDDAAYEHLNAYNERVHVYITDFSYNVIKRSQTSYDLWNVSITLEEV